MMIRFFNQVLADGGAMVGMGSFSSTDIPWPSILSLLAVLTMTVGNIVAIQQNNVKRMLAYSSITRGLYVTCNASHVRRKRLCDHGLSCNVFIYEPRRIFCCYHSKK